MTPATVRGVASAHRWVGLALCLPLLAIAASGALLLFRDALWVPDEWRSVAWDAAAADAALAAVLDADSRWRYVDLARPGRAFHLIGEDVAVPPRVLSIGASSPSPLPVRLAVEQWLFQLHTRLLAGEPGKLVVRIVGPAALASLLAGLVLWWPRRRGWRGRDLLGPGAGSRPGLLRWHLAWGGAAAVVLLPLVGSGALMAHNPAIRAWLAPLSPLPADLAADVSSRRFAPHDLAAALAAARATWPVGAPTQLSRPADAPGRLTVKFRLPGERHPNGRSTLTLDLQEGRVVAARDARLGGVPAAYDDVLYGFHIGELGGPAHAWAWLAGAIGLGLLAVSGTLAWLRRRRTAT